LTEDRTNWGWGAKQPVPMFTEAEIRAACKDFGLLDIDTDSVIEQLNQQPFRASELPGPIRAPVDRLNETLADSGFHYTVQTWANRRRPEAHETEGGKLGP